MLVEICAYLGIKLKKFICVCHINAMPSLSWANYEMGQLLAQPIIFLALPLSAT